MRSENRRWTWRHSSRCIHESMATRTSRGVPGTVLVAVANPAPAICATTPRSSGTLTRVLSSASAWLIVAGLSPTSFPISRSWLSLIRSLDSGSALAPWSPAARASTRSSACRSSSVWRAGTGTGTGDFSLGGAGAMQNYICLNPSEYDIELAGQGVANRVGQRKGRRKRRLHVRAGRPVDRSQIVAHVAVEYLGRGALDEQSAGTHRRGALITLGE